MGTHQILLGWKFLWEFLFLFAQAELWQGWALVFPQAHLWWASTIFIQFFFWVTECRKLFSQLWYPSAWLSHGFAQLGILAALIVFIVVPCILGWYQVWVRQWNRKTCLLPPSPLIPGYREWEEITQVKCKGGNYRNKPETVSNLKIFSVFNVGTKAGHFLCMCLNLQTKKSGLHPKAGISLLCSRFNWGGFIACVLCTVQKVLKPRGFTSEYVNDIIWTITRVCLCVSICRDMYVCGGVCMYVFTTVGWEGLSIPLAEMLAENVVDLTWNQEFFVRNCWLALRQLILGRLMQYLSKEGKRLGKN